MRIIEEIALIIIFFLTSLVSVVTGSTSLITVPAMLQFGVEPRVALATNMFALTFMSVGGTLPFLGKGIIKRRRLPILISLTLAGSILGALLVLVVPPKAVPLVVSVAMIAVALFSLANRNAGIVPAEDEPTGATEFAGYAATFLLGIYGGFFSGGYVTLLTAAYVASFRMTFVEAVSLTKFINIFSSLVATIIFLCQGLINYKLAAVLSVAAFVGAIVGSQVALKIDNLWLRRIFLAAVIALALKTLLYDLLWKSVL